jgi:phage terminase large subunit-like protein
MLNPNKYAEDVKAGKVIAGHLVHLAIERHERDLLRTDIYFDHDAGARVLQFFTILKHTKGKWAGDSFILLPWQQWVLYVLFGWMKADGTRRFRQAYIEVARKNGKSALMGGIGDYMFIADGETGPEVYTGATTTKQAKIVFTEARAMVMNNARLKNRAKVYQHHMELHHDPVSRFEATSREANNMDGLNPHCAIIDEYHAHKNPDIYNVFKSALGSRSQPMQLTITTAGFNQGGPCYQLRRTCIDILKNTKQDDSQFAIIYTLDDGDDWTDSTKWIKSNPSMGITPTLQYLKDEFVQAKNNPGEQVNFKTKNLNIWTSSSTTWIESEVWRKQSATIDLDSLAEMPCYCGLDLATTRDINAYVRVFIDGEHLHVVPTFFVPEDQIEKRSREDGVIYDAWAVSGHLQTTPGNVTDYRYIREYINKDRERFNIKSIAYDRWNSSQLVIELTEDEAPMSPFSQSYAHISVPTKELEKQVYSGNLTHDGNPVMEWMMSNVELSRDPNDNYKPDRKKSTDKIDGVVALVMAIGEWITDMADDDSSYYDDNDLVFI